MKKYFYIILLLSCPYFVYSQNIGISTPDPLMKLHVANDTSLVLLAENTQALSFGISTAIYFKTGNGNFPYTGGIKTIGTGSNVARLGLFTYASPDPDGLFERMSILDNGNIGIGTINPVAKLEVEGEIKVNSINVNAGLVRNVEDPILAQDAATKAYVDALEAKVEALEGVTDIDNNRYKTVTIGTQTWMAENLRTTRYPDGTSIPLVTSNSEWDDIISTPAYCYYNNQIENLVTYGALYNGFAIFVATNGNKDLCPTGWHTPTSSDFYNLRQYLDPGTSGQNNIAGGKTKEAGLVHWNTPNLAATNESGFAGLPGGIREEDGTFQDLGLEGQWWGEYYTWNLQYTVAMNYNNDILQDKLERKYKGLSVRCIKD